MNKITFVLLLSIFCAWPAQAKLFSNSYVSFELPENWECKSEGTEWICESRFRRKGEKINAIIILGAKEAGPADNIAAYIAHLKSPKPLVYKGRKTVSRVTYAKLVRINNHDWVDSLHFASEAPNFYTRYMATIKNNIAIVVTMSAHAKHYTKYSGEFFKSIQSLRAIAQKNIVAGPGIQKPSAGILPIIPPIDPCQGADDEYCDEPWDPEPQGSSNYLTYLAVALLLAAIAAFLLLKKK